LLSGLKAPISVIHLSQAQIGVPWYDALRDKMMDLITSLKFRDPYNLHANARPIYWAKMLQNENSINEPRVD
jgi:hypothetical protein